MRRSVRGCEDVDLTVHAGEFVGITGRSGSGKSTILRGIYRTNVPQQGHIWYDSARYGRVDIAAVSERQMLYLRQFEIGYVSQFLRVLPRTTAFDTVLQSAFEAYGAGDGAGTAAGVAAGIGGGVAAGVAGIASDDGGVAGVVAMRDEASGTVDVAGGVAGTASVGNGAGAGTTCDAARARRETERLLRHFDLAEDLWDLYPLTFSGGEKLRLNIAAAMIKEPRLLLLDEPTASLDNASKRKVRELIEQLKEGGCTMLGIFHDLEFMEGLCDCEYSMEEGTIESVCVR
jgi:alpha-D-ribose 1-methylphosphonate 5-triphosphate synthase subunit PhnL